ncbi:MAG: hypothetical protein V8R75_06205 [Oscillospiraceae bacterium]
MSSFEEKKREIERVLGVFQNYIEGSELLDVVYSKKFGYVLLGLPAADSIDDSDVTRLEDPETLVKEIYQNLAYDFMEQEGHSEDYTEATNLEKRAMREWMKEYTDQLPEYNYCWTNSLDDVSDEAGASLSQSFGMDKADIFFDRTLKLTLGWKIRSHRSENGKKIMGEDPQSLENHGFPQISQLVLHSIKVLKSQDFRTFFAFWIRETRSPERNAHTGQKGAAPLGKSKKFAATPLTNMKFVLLY